MHPSLGPVGQREELCRHPKVINMNVALRHCLTGSFLTVLLQLDAQALTIQMLQTKLPVSAALCRVGDQQKGRSHLDGERSETFKHLSSFNCENCLLENRPFDTAGSSGFKIRQEHILGRVHTSVFAEPLQRFQGVGESQSNNGQRWARLRSSSSLACWLSPNLIPAHLALSSRWLSVPMPPGRGFSACLTKPK